MIECRNVSVELGRQPILRHVSVAVDPGEWLSVVGPNGAGKSTLLRYMAGLVGGRGVLRLAGRDAGSLRHRERARLVALVPQSPLVPEGMRVLDYVLLGRTPHIRPLGSEGPRDYHRAHDALEQLDLLAFSRRVVGTLSGGERQRVLIARALAQQAPIVLLDEPTTALDIGHQQQVLELVDQLRHQHQLTVVTTMHDLTLAGQYADRIALMDAGEIVVDGFASDVLTTDNLERYYGARVRIVHDAAGPAVLPMRERAASD